MIETTKSGTEVARVSARESVGRGRAQRKLKRREWAGEAEGVVCVCVCEE